MKFGFVAKHRGIWPVALMCGTLGVSRGGFYAWLDRPRSQRESGRRGAGQAGPAELRRQRPDLRGATRVARCAGAGVDCGLHRIERLMQGLGLRARPRRRGLPKDEGVRSEIADNVLDRQFTADAPNQKWVADFTYIWTAEGWLYVAVVLDLYSRRVVGWSMQASMTSRLVADALMMAVWRRGKPVALLHHSDQGSQYTSEHFQKLLDAQGITCSMSRAGEVWDNSAMESFFSILKTERMARKVYRTRRGSQGRRVRLHRTVLQPDTSPFDARLRQSDRVRESSNELRLVSTEPAAAHDSTPTDSMARRQVVTSARHPRTPYRRPQSHD